MALIECPECKKEVSDMADICPHCGFNMKRSRSLKNKRTPSIPKEYLKFLLKIGVVGFFLAIIISIIYLILLYYEARIGYGFIFYSIFFIIFDIILYSVSLALIIFTIIYYRIHYSERS